MNLVRRRLATACAGLWFASWTPAQDATPEIVPGAPVQVSLPRSDGQSAELRLRCQSVQNAWLVLVVDGKAEAAAVTFATKEAVRTSRGDSPAYLGSRVLEAECPTVVLRGVPGATHRVLILAFPLLEGEERKRLDGIFEHVRVTAAALDRDAEDEAAAEAEVALREAAALLDATGSHEVVLALERIGQLRVGGAALEAANRLRLSFWTSRVPKDHFLRSDLQGVLAVEAAERGEVEQALATCRSLLANAIATGAARSSQAQQLRLALQRVLLCQGDFDGALEVGRECLANWHGRGTAADEAWAAVKCQEVWLRLQIGDVETALIEGERLDAQLTEAHVTGSRTRTRLLGYLADISVALGDVERARRWARTMLAATEQGQPDDVEALVDAHMHICDVDLEAEADAEAVEVATRACVLARHLRPESFMAQWPRLALAEALPLSRNDEAIDLAHRVLASPCCTDDDASTTQYARLVLSKRHRLAGKAREALGFAELALASCVRSQEENREYVDWAKGECMLAHFDLGETIRSREILMAESARFEQRLLRLFGVVDARSLEGARQTMQKLVHWLLSFDVAPGDSAAVAAQLYTVLRFRGLTERRARLARIVEAAAVKDPSLASARRVARNSANAVRRAREQGLEDPALQALSDRARAAEDDLARHVRALPEAQSVLEPMPLADLLAPLASTDALLLSTEYSRELPFDREKGARPASEARIALFVAWKRADGNANVMRFEIGSTKALVEGCEVMVRWSAAARGRPVENATGVGRNVLGVALAPVIDALPADTQTLWICPEGALAAIPWEVVMVARSGQQPQMLVDRYRVRYVESPMALHRRASSSNEPSLLVFGGIDYGEAKGEAPAPPSAGRPPVAAADASTSDNWPSLPWSEAEAEVAASAFAASHPSARLVRRSGVGATKSEFVAHAGEATTIHVATHAVVVARRRHAQRGSVGEGDRAADSTAYLVFAGANVRRQDHDALLSEQELEWLDLGRCELAVLSACSTNVGVRRSGEATCGLNRAAQLAGARNTIASLWPVSDAGSAAFFTTFYGALWGEGRTVADAFAAARASVRKTFGWGVWAAFVLYETGPPHQSSRRRGH